MDKVRAGFTILTYNEKKCGKINPNRLERPDCQYIIMMLRQYGDIGFIGGKLDPEDASVIEGVKRELREEIGLLNPEEDRFKKFSEFESDHIQVYTYRYELTREELKDILTNQYNPIESLERKKENDHSQIAFENFGLMIVPINHYIRTKEGKPLSSFLEHKFAGNIRDEFLDIVDVLVEEFDDEETTECYKRFKEIRNSIE